MGLYHQEGFVGDGQLPDDGANWHYRRLAGEPIHPVIHDALGDLRHRRLSFHWFDSL